MADRLVKLGCAAARETGELVLVLTGYAEYRLARALGKLPPGEEMSAADAHVVRVPALPSSRGWHICEEGLAIPARDLSAWLHAVGEAVDPSPIGDLLREYATEIGRRVIRADALGRDDEPED